MTKFQSRAGQIQKISRFWIQDSFQNFRVQSKFLIGFFKRIDSKIESRFKNFEDSKKDLKIESRFKIRDSKICEIADFC